MSAQLKRKNAALLEFLRAGLVALVTYAALSGLDFAPAWGAAVLALAAGVLTLASFEFGALVGMLAIAVPVLAVAPVAGVLLIVVALVLLRYVGAASGAVFCFVGAAVLAAFIGPAWAVVGIAGYALGARRGALAAALGCVAVELTGFALGMPVVGQTATSGAAPVVDVSAMPSDLFSATWVTAAIENLNGKAIETFSGSLAHLSSIALIVQPLLWAAGAIVAAKIGAALWQSGRDKLAPLATVPGIAVPAVAALLIGSTIGLPNLLMPVVTAAALSSVVAVAAAYAWDFIFPIETPAPAAATGSVPTTMAAEDEDVDELLRLIATAEEKVATQYTTVKTVMITDMKSFSRMTEEYGSALTAKAVQRHRDILLPVIQKHGGQGKSTGGDGLIAAFDDAAAAVAAAVEMQQVLAAHNQKHQYEHEMTVRCGIAYGEVVLDRGGRPFIGNALNVAARIMNLADGGQAFTTASVVGRAGLDVSTHSHGTFDLKNIDKPVEVIELIWHEGQVPIDPRGRRAPD